MHRRTLLRTMMSFGFQSESSPLHGDGGRDREFDRPVIIISAPRSGSTLLFETLARAKNVYTLGTESFNVIKSVRALDPATRGFQSHRLDASAASGDVIRQLRARFRGAVFDRHGAKPTALPLRMLEKTPRNALRIPFLAKVFPEAHFVYLHRRAEEVLASMMEAWASGRFDSFRGLPGWSRSGWSFLLTPGWRNLDGKPLHEIVAAQWQTTMSILLDDFSALPPERIHKIRYDALLRDPRHEIARLCAELDLQWDQPLEETLPLSSTTLSQPGAEKWRRYVAELDAVRPGLHATIERSEHFAG